jgi:hypothetical protein
MPSENLHILLRDNYVFNYYQMMIRMYFQEFDGIFQIQHSKYSMVEIRIFM